MVSKRFCCVEGCENTYKTHSLFSFPKLETTPHSPGDWLFSKEFRRCLYWIQKTGNPSLLLQDPGKLRQRVFMCSEHFSKDQLAGSGRKLKANSYPNLFSHCGLSEEDMQNYTNNLMTGFRDAPHPHLSQTAVRAGPKRIRRKCRVLGCRNNERTSSMFAFPRVRRLTFPPSVDDFQYNRCKSWVRLCGNEKLLAWRLEDLCKRAHLCCKHFGDHHFYNKMKKKLYSTAVPCKHLPDPLTGEAWQTRQGAVYLDEPSSQGGLLSTISRGLLCTKPQSA